MTNTRQASAALRRALAKQANYQTFGYGVMTLGDFLATKMIVRKSTHVRTMSRKRICLENKVLASPVAERTLWWTDPQTGRDRGLDVPRVVYDSYDVPERVTRQSAPATVRRGSLVHLHW